MKKGARENLEGIRSGKLLIVDFAYYEPKTRTNYWFCACDCGNIKALPGTVVKKGKVVSCGCFLKDNIKEFNKTHGMSYSREHRIWRGMKARCYNPKNQDYHHYGERGITVCQEWVHSFENFFTDMGECPAGMSLDRIDVDGNYEKSNCRWASDEQQHNNTRKTRLIEYCGTTMSVTQWERSLGVNQYQLANWLRKGGADGKGKGRTIQSFIIFHGITVSSSQPVRGLR